ncbi:competence type IV pilus minor pilin ComGF [Rossellomorea aquimaris]|uniref:competence type IV pilus minor pilin ComGF n=1 Tax=Bacillaceae TaxID=186817 RepID=UPI0013B05910|nr:MULTISPECIES: competence type IV pilus minor pilin ComGF [Bacillaceae]
MRDQKGYTLLHAVFTLSIFLLAAICTPVIFNAVSYAENRLSPSKEYEWNLFSQQFRQEFHGSEDIKVNDSSIVFSKNGEVILYERYGDFLRRRVNRRGHELVLGPLQALEFSPCKNGVEINAVFEGEAEKTGRFFTYAK